MLKKIRLNSFAVIFSVVLLFLSLQNATAHVNVQNNNENLTTNQQVAQQNFDEVEIKTIPVRNNIYMLTGDGGNIGVSVGDDGTLLIDSQFAGLTEKINKAVTQINKQPIKYLINTHYHFDHTNGNENIRALGATIIAHDNVPKQMSVDHNFDILGMKIEASPKNALPMITFNQSTNFSINNNDINAFHISLAHTDGDVVVHFKDQNVIHTGDLFFNGFYPFIDTGVGGSIDGMIAAIDKILPLCNDKTLIIPGHGGLSNRQELINFQNMLKTVSSRVKAAISNNMSLEDLIKTKPLADLDDAWGKGFLNSEQFVSIAYRGMKK